MDKTIRHILFKNDIQVIRISKNYSQNQLARAIGVRRDELSIIENGHRLPTKEILNNIKLELGCMVSDLYPLNILKLIYREDELS